MDKQFVDSLTVIVRNAVKGSLENARPDLDRLLKISAMHHISCLVYTGAVAAEIDKNAPQMKQMFIAANRDILIHEIQLQELSKIKEALQKSGVDYMLLKGCILKNMYPSPDMRVMSDADILIRQYDKIADIMQKLGYTLSCESDHEYIWKKEGRLVIEFHKRLIPSYNSDYYAYFGDGFERAFKKESGAFEYQFTDEDGFIYLFTHFAKHYRDGGIGIKHLTDLYVYLKHFQKLDMQYIENELKKLSLYEFYRNILDTLGVWFDKKPSTPITEHITQVIISSGAYGTHKAHIRAFALRHQSGKGVFLQRAFPPLSIMKIKYKYLEKMPILLPFAWGCRIVNALFYKQDRIKTHTKDMKSISRSDIENYENSLLYVGLKFQKRKKNK